MKFLNKCEKCLKNVFLKKMIIPFLVLFICISLVYANTDAVSIALLEQDPDPAGSGELVRLRLDEVSNAILFSEVF